MRSRMQRRPMGPGLDDLLAPEAGSERSEADDSGAWPYTAREVTTMSRETSRGKATVRQVRGKSSPRPAAPGAGRGLTVHKRMRMGSHMPAKYRYASLSFLACGMSLVACGLNVGRTDGNDYIEIMGERMSSEIGGRVGETLEDGLKMDIYHIYECNCAGEGGAYPGADVYWCSIEEEGLTVEYYDADVNVGEAMCTPNCTYSDTESSCGDDSCGGSCGYCGEEEVCVWVGGGGLCKACTESCTGKECGYSCDGALCGVCASGKSCDGSKCVPCIPDCDGKQCGPDWCGGVCGECGYMEGCLWDLRFILGETQVDYYKCVQCLGLQCGYEHIACMDMDADWANGNEYETTNQCAYECLLPFTMQWADGMCGF